MYGDEISTINLECDVLVVGAGPAGCCCALKAKEKGLDVLVLDKADTKWSGSMGRGVDLLHSLGCLPSFEAALKSSQISYKRYYDEEGLANPNMIYQLWAQEKWALEEFEKYASLKWYDGDYLWAGTGGAYAGASLRVPGLDYKPKLAAALKQNKVRTLNRTMLVDLIKDGGRIAGATAVSTRNAQFYAIRAKAVILASGSNARHFDPELSVIRYKYKYHHCPSAIAGDGVAAAYKIGAELVNMDLTEGSVPHQDYTCITRGCLIGVRPVKTKEYTWDGEDLYTKNPNELSKKMYRTLDEMGKTPIYRGMDHMSEVLQKKLETNYVDEGFANLMLAGKRGFNPVNHRFDVARDKPYPVDASAIQMSGLFVDDHFMTTIPGLYGIGDTASCVGAVMSAIVTGFYTGNIVEDYINTVNEPELDASAVGFSKKEALAPLDVTEGQEPIELEGAIRQLNERYIGVFKSEGKLVEGMHRLASLKKEFFPKMKAENAHYLMRCLETKSIMQISEIYIQACLSRQETRGFYNRADYPQKDPARDGQLTYQRLDENGEMIVDIRPAPELKAEYAAASAGGDQ